MLDETLHESPCGPDRPGMGGTARLAPRQGRAVKSPKVAAPDLVFVDGSGHCYLQGDTNRSMDQHRGERPYPAEVVTRWRESLSAGAAAVRALGGEYVFLIAPDKQTVRWDHIGGGRPDHRNSMAIFGQRIPGLTVVDPATPLIEAARERDVYPPTDSHWDMRGAHIAYRQLLPHLKRAVGEPLEEGKNFTFFEISSAGDLGRKLIPPREGPAARIRRLGFRERLIYRNGVRTNGAIHLHRKVGLGNTCLLFSDSFGAHLAPYLAEHFGFLVHVRTTHVDNDLVRQLRPDTVISEVTERFMARPPLLREDEPVELLFIHKIAFRETKREQLLSVRRDLPDRELPPALLAVVDRNDALADLELFPGPEITPRQTQYAAEIFDGATASDAVVAAYIAHRRGRQLGSSWQRVLAMLHPETLSRLETALQASGTRARRSVPKAE